MVTRLDDNAETDRADPSNGTRRHLIWMFPAGFLVGIAGYVPFVFLKDGNIALGDIAWTFAGILVAAFVLFHVFGWVATWRSASGARLDLSRTASTPADFYTDLTRLFGRMDRTFVVAAVGAAFGRRRAGFDRMAQHLVDLEHLMASEVDVPPPVRAACAALSATLVDRCATPGSLAANRWECRQILRRTVAIVGPDAYQAMGLEMPAYKRGAR
jgi:hypothetical protein